MKKVLSVCISILMLILSCFTNVYAEGGSDAYLFDEGNCGQYIYWFYTYATKNFEVTGNGAMENYDSVGNIKRDYERYINEIKTVVIDDGITSIGSNAFYSCKSLESIQFPNTLNRIGDNAFRDCKMLNYIEMPKNVDYIGTDAFSGISNLTVKCDKGSYADNYSLYPSGTVILYYGDASNNVALKVNESILNTNHQTAGYVMINYGKPETDSGADDAFGRLLQYNNSLSFECERGGDRVHIVSGNAECIFDNFVQNSYNIKDVVNALDKADTAEYSVDEGYGDYSLGENQNYVTITNDTYSLEICYSNNILTKSDYVRITFKEYTPQISVILDGNTLSFEQQPTIIEGVSGGRVMVPLRDIFEAMGANVKWNSENKTITAVKGKITVQMTIGSNVMTKNGVKITLDVPAQLVSGYTMIPVRAIAEAFGSDVDWDANKKIVTIDTF
jgi:hypothetical protein